MDYESFLGMDGKRAIGAAVDAFFVETRRIITEQSLTQASLTVLGEELGKMAKVVYGAHPLAAGESGWSGVSRVLRADPDGLTLVQVRFTSPREASAVHEHRSWWVLRVINGQEYYTEYDRLDDGKREGYAELQPGPERLLVPEDVLTALKPVIHLHADYKGQTVDELMLLGENPGQNPFRRFDPEAKTTFVSPPRKYDSR
jgi:predicted metal-dependent enzyme (double-stranded beta helix superfamily)